MKHPRIDCHRCRHYYVTWDQRFSHGCKAMNFKSRELPSIVVQRNSGEPCHYYSPKPTPSRGKTGGNSGTNIIV